MIAAKNATATIPIVMINVGDPVALGLVESLAHPSGNVTGRSFTVGAETFEKGLELLDVPLLLRDTLFEEEARPQLVVRARAPGGDVSLHRGALKLEGLAQHLRKLR